VYQEKTVSTPQTQNGTSESNWEDIAAEEAAVGIDTVILLWETYTFS
jgi:hypothetical protein